MRLASLLAPHTVRSSKTTLKSVSLENIRVAAPCPASWEQMSGDDRVRHCAECNLNVYNLSEMTRHEAESLIANREGRLCVRFYRRADGTILTRNCPRGLQAMVRRVSRIAGAALSAVMIVGTAFAQSSQQAPAESKKEQAVQQKAQLTLTVTDERGAIIPRAKIRLTNKDTRIIYTAATGSNGVGVLSGLAPGSFVLRIEALGFNAYEKAITINQNKNADIQLVASQKVETVVMGGLIAVPRDDFLRELPLR